MAKITGIGGVFFKAKSDPKTLAAWYEQHLGLKLEPFGGAALRWPDDHAEDNGVTAWHVAKPETEWFPGAFMINYRVDDMKALVEQLRRADIQVKGPEFHENGAFAWVTDPDGNRVELWEPKLWDDKNKRDA